LKNPAENATIVALHEWESQKQKKMQNKKRSRTDGIGEGN
jgi:hypothetical protein